MSRGGNTRHQRPRRLRCLGLRISCGVALPLGLSGLDELRTAGATAVTDGVVSMAVGEDPGEFLSSSTSVCVTERDSRGRARTIPITAFRCLAKEWLSGPPSVPHRRLGFSVYVFPLSPNCVLGTVRRLVSECVHDTEPTYLSQQTGRAPNGARALPRYTGTAWGASIDSGLSRREIDRWRLSRRVWAFSFDTAPLSPCQADTRLSLPRDMCEAPHLERTLRPV